MNLMSFRHAGRIIIMYWARSCACEADTNTTVECKVVKSLYSLHDPKATLHPFQTIKYFLSELRLCGDICLCVCSFCMDMRVSELPRLIWYWIYWILSNISLKIDLYCEKQNIGKTNLLTRLKLTLIIVYDTPNVK